MALLYNLSKRSYCKFHQTIFCMEFFYSIFVVLLNQFFAFLCDIINNVWHLYIIFDSFDLFDQDWLIRFFLWWIFLYCKGLITFSFFCCSCIGTYVNQFIVYIFWDSFESQLIIYHTQWCRFLKSQESSHYFAKYGSCVESS